MAFKEVRRRSHLFRPWDSVNRQPTNCRTEANKCESSPPPTLTTSTIKSNDKRNGFKSDISKTTDHHIISSQKSVSSLCDNIPLSCPPLPSMTREWPSNHHLNPNQIMAKQNLMLCPPHSGLPFAEHLYYEPLHQPYVNPTPFCDQSLMTTTNISRQWRQLQHQKKQRPKRFQCPHCRVSFSNNGQLKGHIRIHTGI